MMSMRPRSPIKKSRPDANFTAQFNSSNHVQISWIDGPTRREVGEALRKAPSKLRQKLSHPKLVRVKLLPGNAG
jgi:hypothetical protein